MKLFHSICSGVLLVCLESNFSLVAQTAAAPKPKQLLAGAATSNITPEIGDPIVGGFHPPRSTHVHDELHARCLVLDNGQTRMAIVVCDLLGLAQQVCDAARSLIHAESSIPEESILICATHTHSATTAMGTNRFAYNSPLDDYQKFVVRRIADGVLRAANNLAPAKIGWAVGHDSKQVFNRRWLMKPGSVGRNPFGGTNDVVRMNPPRQSKDLVEPAGPTDPEICLVAVQSLDGRPLALLANYSLHYVGGVRDGDISADYFAVFCDRIQQLLGADRQDPPFVAMLSNGTSGDINNIDFSKAGEKSAPPPYQKMRQVADEIAREALKAYKKIKFHDWVPLGGQLQLVEIGVRHPTPEQLDRARQIVARAGDPPKLNSTEQIYAERSLRMNEYPPTLPMPVQALRIGEVGIAGLPNEIFCETGLELKRRSPFKPSFTMEIANGYYGYLPTPEQHKLGGYESWLGTNRLEPDTSTKYVEALLRMWEELKNQP
jgi:neutral ceramidase